MREGCRGLIGGVAADAWFAVWQVGCERFADAVRAAIRAQGRGLGVPIVSEFGWVVGWCPAF